MSIFEQYCANVPLFFPTKELLKKIYNTDLDPLSEVSYFKVHNQEYQNYFNLVNDPNNYNNFDIINDWLDLADFYNFKNIVYYDNLYDINKLSFNKDLQIISEHMKKENIDRKEKIYHDWNVLLGNIK
jgi:hypothetical protein